MRDLYTLTSSVLPDEARVVAFRATEAISRPYQLDLWLVAPDAGDFDLSEAVAGKVALAIAGDDDRPDFALAGVVSSLRLLNQMPGAGLYHAVVVPKLRLLSQSRHSRVFTKMKVPEILESVLQEGGLASSDYELRLQADYEVEEHVAQYQESDLDFLHRWMEHEGIYYFFEHTDEGEKLVVTDAKSTHEALPDRAVRYRPGFAGDDSAAERFAMFTCEHRALPASVAVADADYLRPALEMRARADVSRTGFGEVVFHNARFFTPKAGARYAKIRAEELLCREVVYEAEGTALYLRPGYHFELEDHPRAAFDQKYLCTEIVHEGSLDGWSPDGETRRDRYHCKVTAIAADVQFRPRRVTAWPHAYGVEGGTVDGPARSEYAQIDDHGRYAVKMRFDESKLKDGKASTWVRMAQPHGGDVEGFHFPLRKGTEVMFAHLGGDPDRPIIAAVAPNAQTPSPVTAKNHTSNVIQTGGRNRFEFEDRSGSQRTTVSSPTETTYLRMGAPNDDVNCYLSTEGNGKIEVGGGVCAPLVLTVTTVGPKTERVKGSVTEEYHGPFSTTVTNAVEEHYHHDKEETVTGAVTETYETSQTVLVHGKLEEKYGSQTTHVTGARAETVDEAVKEELKGPLTTTVTNHATEHFDAKYKLEVKGPMLHQVSGPITRFITGKLEHEDKNQMKAATGATGKLTLGLVNETFIGFKIEILLGGKAEATVGMKMETVGCKCEFHTFKAMGEPAVIEMHEGHLKFESTKGNAFAGPMMRIAQGLNSHGGGFLFKN